MMKLIAHGFRAQKYGGPPIVILQLLDTLYCPVYPKTVQHAKPAVTIVRNAWFQNAINPESAFAAETMLQNL